MQCPGVTHIHPYSQGKCHQRTYQNSSRDPSCSNLHSQQKPGLATERAIAYSSMGP